MPHRFSSPERQSRAAPRFRSSRSLAAHSDTNFGNIRGAAKIYVFWCAIHLKLLNALAATSAGASNRRLVVFFLTSPRIGLLALLLVLVFLFLKINLAVYHWIAGRIRDRWVGMKKHPKILNLGVGLVLAIVFLGLYVGFSLGVVKVASTRDWRIGLVANSSLASFGINSINDLNENTLLGLGLRFAFLERTAYWMDGWHIFNDYPILGVGLGNSGFYFPNNMPSIGYSTYEIRTVLYLSTSLPNIKSFWYRLLAETGIAGFSLFIAWMLVTWFSTSCSIRSRDATIKTLALAGQLALLAFVFEGFSVDTFGLPYLWIITGLAAATGMIYRRQWINSQNGPITSGTN